MNELSSNEIKLFNDNGIDPNKFLKARLELNDDTSDIMSEWVHDLRMKLHGIIMRIIAQRHGGNLEGVDLDSEFDIVIRELQQEPIFAEI